MFIRILIKFLKSRLFLLGSTVVFTLVVWWVVATMFNLSLTVKLLGIVVLLFIFVVILVIGFIRADRNAAAIEQSIMSGAENQIVSTRPDRREAIKEMQVRLEAAIESLKKSKLRSGWRGRGALYALPWYIFIGPPGSGKTTALANSGLNFPMGFDRIKGVGGTRDCDWFFSDTGIFLDTAGRWVVDHDDEEFTAFLDVLRNNRKKQPINGVLLALSMKDIAVLEPAELEEHAIRIRRRISDLIVRLGVRFPVYVILTKCDLIPGFVETFGHLKKSDRERIWGSTIPAEHWDKSADKLFSEEFDGLLKQIVNHRSEQLKHGLKREVRSKVFSFPIEIAAFRQRIATVLGQVFQSNPYQETAIFRGFYFTSGTQEGAPIDSVIREIARQFDLKEEVREIEPEELTTKSYFIHDVFQEVVVPDRFLARQTSRASSKLRKTQVAVALSAIAGLAVCVLLVVFAAFRSTAEIDEMENAALFAWGARFEQGSDLSFEMGKIERLATSLSDVESSSFRPLLLGLGRADDVATPANRLFHLKIRELAEYRILPELERHIIAATRDNTDGGATVTKADLYRLLHAYLLLTVETVRLSEEDQRTFLVAEMEDALRASARASGDQLDVAGLGDQFRAFVDALADGSVRGLPANTPLVRRAQWTLVQGGSTGAVGTYLRMRQKGLAELRPYRLADMLQGAYANLFDSEAAVQGLFTQDGWHGYMFDEIDRMGTSGQSEEWVLGRQRSIVDTTGLKSKIEQFYFGDYASAWATFLRQVRILPFESPTQAAQNLRELSREGDSPIALLLAEANRQTTFAGPKPPPDRQGGRVSEELGELVGGAADDMPPSVEIVNSQFKWLADYRPGDMATQAGLPVGQALQGLARVGAFLETVAGDESATTQTVAEVLSKSGGELEFELRGIRNALGRMDPDVRGNLFEAPVESAWLTLLAVAQSRLNALWKREIYDVQRELLQGDPISPDGFGEIPIRDFDDFFRPGDGILDSFVSTYLTSFIKDDLSGAKTWRRSGIALSRDLITALAKAREIQAGLFPRGELRLEFDLRAELPQRDVNAPVPSLTVLTLHGTTYRYSMGIADWIPFSWPGPPGASLTITTDKGPLPERRYEGNWAIFRMLGDARIRAGSSRALYIVELPTPHGITLPYEMRFDTRRTPFGDPRFFDFKAPERLN